MYVRFKTSCCGANWNRGYLHRTNSLYKQLYCCNVNHFCTFSLFGIKKEKSYFNHLHCCITWHCSRISYFIISNKNRGEFQTELSPILIITLLICFRTAATLAFLCTGSCMRTPNACNTFFLLISDVHHRRHYKQRNDQHYNKINHHTETSLLISLSSFL